MGRKWRRVAVCSGLAIAGAMSAYFLSGVEFFQLVNLKAQDLHFLLRNKIRRHAVPVSNIVLLTIDQQSLNTFPEVQLFWHPYYAEAIKASAAAGAKVLVLDVAFGVPVGKWEPRSRSDAGGGGLDHRASDADRLRLRSCGNEMARPD